MTRSQKPAFRTEDRIEVKSKLGAEFRRFSLLRAAPGSVEELWALLRALHCLRDGTTLRLQYAAPGGELLPITNCHNYARALATTSSTCTAVGNPFRLFLLTDDMADTHANSTPDGRKRTGRPRPVVGPPIDFHPLASVIDADVLPASLLRVRLYREGTSRPLGFYIVEGSGMGHDCGVFISRLLPSGLAACSGLLAVGDEVVEVNGVTVSGRSLDQVTAMMVANGHNLVMTVRPAMAPLRPTPRRASMQPQRPTNRDGGSAWHSVSTSFPTQVWPNSWRATRTQASQPTVTEISSPSDDDDDQDEVRDFVLHNEQSSNQNGRSSKPTIKTNGMSHKGNFISGLVKREGNSITLYI
uniref:partitioning defective 6 homolog beta-like n=1 Tax=Myxine glutinosa TaxID=7769 RepID=UPI00358E044B